METRFEYLGHSCFRITSGGKSVILDPYKKGSVPGTELPDGLEADAVYCSHQHGDHNAAELVKVTSGCDPFETDVITIPHDDAGGKLRGMSDIRFIRMPGCTAVHLGDAGIVPDEGILAKIAEADVMMIPVGGHYTISAEEAYEIIQKTGVKLVILMHFRRGAQGYDVLSPLDDVTKVIKGTEILDASSVVFDPGAGNRIVVLKP